VHKFECRRNLHARHGTDRAEQHPLAKQRLSGLQAGDGAAGPKALNQLDVRGLGSLVAGLGVVGDLCAIGE
jgi:hypothetical protein